MNERRFQAALVDMDGVLYNSMKYHTLAWQRMIQELGFGCTRDEFYLYEGMTGHATIDMLFRKHLGREATKQEADMLYHRKSEYFKEYGEIETIDGTNLILNAMREIGLKHVLVTGSAQGSLLKRIDIDYPNIFAPGMRITALDVIHGKPHPEPYLSGARKAGVDPARAIVIENAPLGVQAGKAAGCFTVAVTTGPVPEQTMYQAGADRVFASMHEFAKALPEILGMEI